ncbi:MAG: ferredoxin-type protein NapF [Gammaproteobacteria bacterium]|nr:ferredoxin-type protein NapF [Gammaproteobacteria bacterium]
MVSRANFIRGKFSNKTQAIRPPWSIDEQQFTDLCHRCDDCIKACPGKIIERGDAGFPQVNFRLGECDFCGDCEKSCKTNALHKIEEDQQPWQLNLLIKEDCLVNKNVVCRSCGEVCDERAIRFKPKIGGVFIPEFDLGQCSGCGACVNVCPVNAVQLSV